MQDYHSFYDICGAESDNPGYRGFKLRSEAVLVSMRCPILCDPHCQDVKERKQTRGKCSLIRSGWTPYM
jgi:hypothetical protein